MERSFRPEREDNLTRHLQCPTATRSRHHVLSVSESASAPPAARSSLLPAPGVMSSLARTAAIAAAAFDTAPRRRRGRRHRGRVVVARAKASAASNAADKAKSKATYALGVDVGTQGTKAILYDLDARAVAGRGAKSYGLLPNASANAAEQDPATWLDGVRVAVKNALADARATPDAIACVGVSGQQHGMVCLDAEGAVVRPAKLWCDTESAAEATELGKMFGWNMQAGFTASKVRWLKNVEPQNWERTKTVCLPHDYVNYFMTGEMHMERGDASGIGVMDMEAREIDEAKCDAVDARFFETLPKLLPPDVEWGKVTPDAGAFLGLPAGIPVSVGSGDNMMSALGAGCVNEGRLVVSLGTSGTLFGYNAETVPDPTAAIQPFCDATGVYLPLLCSMNCTRVVGEARQAFGGGRSHEELAEEAKSVPPGSGGVRFLPYLVGERSPNWPHAMGTLTGLRPGSLCTPGVVYNAAMEGATYALLGGLKRMSELGLSPPTELAVVGGGSKSKWWRQIIADAFDTRVTWPVEPETAALGAALQAAALVSGASTRAFVEENPPAYADDVSEPNPDAAAAHAENYEEFVREGEALFVPEIVCYVRGEYDEVYA